jgi:AhpD family alkylhydroperoxidase
MSKKGIFREIEDVFCVLPSLFKESPGSLLEHEWKLFSKIQLKEGTIPLKYRELIGLAISGVTKCRYCIYNHTEVARLFGATDEEIEGAVHYAKLTAGWSAYVNGQNVDYDLFSQEVDQACEHVWHSREGESVVTESERAVH